MADRVCPNCGAVVVVDVSNCPICFKSMSGRKIYGAPAGPQSVKPQPVKPAEPADDKTQTASVKPAESQTDNTQSAPEKPAEPQKDAGRSAPVGSEPEKPEEAPKSAPAAPSAAAPAKQENPSGVPATIEALSRWCSAREMPLFKLRFFVGVDCREPKAFGIYRSNDEFIVYKIKADGSRSVRYRGKDEAFAVNELYQKLLSECHARGIHPERGDHYSESAWSSYSEISAHPVFRDEKHSQIKNNTIGSLRQYLSTATASYPGKLKTSFAIGVYVQSRNTIGIYEQDGKYIVYRNPPFGDTEILYEGGEECAVIRARNEIRKCVNPLRLYVREEKKKLALAIAIILFVFVISRWAGVSDSGQSGYSGSRSGSSYYYYYDDDDYDWGSSSDWDSWDSADTDWYGDW